MSADLSVRDRVFAGFALVLGLIVLVSVVIGLQFAKVSRLASHISGEVNDQISASHRVSAGVSKENTGLRGYALAGEQRFYREYTQGTQQRRSAMLQLRDALKDPNERARLARLETACSEFDVAAEKVLEHISKHEVTEAFDFHQAHLQPLAANITATATTISSAGHSRLRNVNTELLASQARLNLTSRLLLVGATIVLAITAVVTARSVGRPAAALASAAKAIEAGNYAMAGDLIHKAGLAQETNGNTPRSELARIGSAVHGMSQALEIRERTLTAHASVLAACASAMEPAKLMELTLPEIARHTDSQVGAAYIVDTAGLKLLGTYGVTPEAAQALLEDAGGYVRQAADSQTTLLIDDIPTDSAFVIDTGLGSIVPRAVASVPLIADDNTIGVICLGSVRPFGEHANELLHNSANQLSIALSKARQHQYVRELVDELAAMNEELNHQNEELQGLNEEIQSQNEEIETQNEDLLAQSQEVQERNIDLELRTRDLSALQAVTAVALSTLERNELLRGLVEAVCTHAYLQFGLVMLPDEDGTRLRIAITHSLGDVPPTEIDIAEGLPGSVAQSHEMRVIDAVESDIRLLGLESKAPDARMLIALPLIAAGKLWGVAVLGSAEVRELSPSETQLLSVFASRAAVGLERSESIDRLRQAEERERLERLRIQAIIENLPEGVVITSAPDGFTEMANTAALSLHGLNEVPAATWSEHPKAFNLFRPDGEPMGSEEVPLTRSLLEGERCMAEEVVIRQPSGKKVTALCNSVPMRDASGNIIGAVGVFHDITNIKTQQVVLQQVAERERKIAETLQKSFLPSAMPQVPGYEIGHAYIPARQDAQVGGDFYDLIELAPGKIGVVMGDVSGKGVSAAVYTAMAKYMLRAFAHEHDGPAEVMQHLNEAMTQYTSTGVFVTLFYGVLYTEDRRLLYSNGGHELPLRVQSASGNCVPLTSTGPALGVLPRADYAQREIVLDEGDAFVMYTDGITEARRGKEFLGSEGLERIVAESSSENADEMTHSILAGVHAYAGDSFSDDVALVVIKSRRDCNIDE